MNGASQEKLNSSNIVRLTIKITTIILLFFYYKSITKFFYFALSSTGIVFVLLLIAKAYNYVESDLQLVKPPFQL